MAGGSAANTTDVFTPRFQGEKMVKGGDTVHNTGG